MVSLRFLLLLLCAPAGWGCTCNAESKAPACEVFDQSKVVFVGTVLEGSDPVTARESRQRLFLVRVDEAFRGLNPDEREVFIDPAQNTSCGSYLAAGERYLFFLGGPLRIPAISFLARPDTTKPLPASWENKKGLRVFTNFACSPTRGVQNAEEDLRWIRSRLRGETNTQVFGYAVQNEAHFLYRYLGPGPPAHLPKAKIHLTGPEGTQTVLAGPDGRYCFGEMAPGKYSLSGERESWTSPEAQQIEVRPGGCIWRDLSFGSKGKILGKVVDAAGLSVRGYPVYLKMLRLDGSIGYLPAAQATTDNLGRFELDPVPAGPVVLGALYGYSTLRDAKRFDFRPGSRIEGQVIRLGLRRLRVIVLTADSSPVDGPVEVTAMYQAQLGAEASAPEGNVVNLLVGEGRQYEIRATAKGQGSGKADLRMGSAPATVVIRVKP